MIRRAEVDVASGIADAHRLVDDAFDRLRTEGEHAAAVIGEDIRGVEWVVGQAATAAGAEAGRLASDAWHTTEHLADTAWHDTEVVVDAAFVEPAEQDWADIPGWVKKHQGLLKTVSGALGVVGTAAAFLSVIPGVGEIALPVSMAMMGLKTLDDGVLAASGAETGAAFFGDLADDALFGVGELAGVGVKALNMAANEGEAAAVAGEDAAGADRAADLYQDMAESSDDSLATQQWETRASEARQNAATARDQQQVHEGLAKRADADPAWAQRQAAAGERHALTHPVSAAVSAVKDARATGLRTYVGSAWREGTVGPGRGIYAVNMGLQAQGAVRDTPDAVTTVRGWVTGVAPAG